MWVAFAKAKATHIFFSAKNISIYAIFNNQSFNDTLTKDIVSFEQLGQVEKICQIWSYDTETCVFIHSSQGEHYSLFYKLLTIHTVEHEWCVAA